MLVRDLPVAQDFAVIKEVRTVALAKLKTQQYHSSSPSPGSDPTYAIG
jgi:hypothetical protein